MIFQTFSNLFYYDNNFHKTLNINIPKLQTWNYSNELRNFDNIEYAKIFTNAKSPLEICPPELKANFIEKNTKIEAQIRSLFESKVSYSDHSLARFLPLKTTKKVLFLREKIIGHVFENYNKPSYHDHLVNVLKMTNDLNDYIVNYENYKTSVKYNPFGTKTGRLTTHKNSFPILTLNKNKRHKIRPNNELFIELDYNAFECRVLTSLLNKEQYNDDLHMLHSEKLGVNRDKAKQMVYAWLYNLNSQNETLNLLYDRDTILNQYYNNEYITTPFGRKILVANLNTALNNTIQSTASDIFLEQACKIHKSLKGKKTKIAFLIHDSLVLDFSLKEKELLEQILHEFSNTRFGILKVNIKKWKNNY